MTYYYIGFYQKFEKFTHVRIVAQAYAADRDELRSMAVKLDEPNGKRWRVIAAQNKSEAMQQLSNISKSN